MGNLKNRFKGGDLVLIRFLGNLLQEVDGTNIIYILIYFINYQ